MPAAYRTETSCYGPRFLSLSTNLDRYGRYLPRGMSHTERTGQTMRQFTPRPRGVEDRFQDEFGKWWVAHSSPVLA